VFILFLEDIHQDIMNDSKWCVYPEKEVNLRKRREKKEKERKSRGKRDRPPTPLLRYTPAVLLSTRRLGSPKSRWNI
jgi:hypothetical protein